MQVLNATTATATTIAALFVYFVVKKRVKQAKRERENTIKTSTYKYLLRLTILWPNESSKNKILYENQQFNKQSCVAVP